MTCSSFLTPGVNSISMTGAADACQLFEYQITGVVRRSPKSTARGLHPITQELIPPEYIEYLELNQKTAVVVFDNPADDNDVGTKQTPVIEIEFTPGVRKLEHVTSRDGIEAPAAGKITADDSCNVNRWLRSDSGSAGYTLPITCCESLNVNTGVAAVEGNVCELPAVGRPGG